LGKHWPRIRAAPAASASASRPVARRRRCPRPPSSVLLAVTMLPVRPQAPAAVTRCSALRRSGRARGPPRGDPGHAAGPPARAPPRRPGLPEALGAPPL